jgi:DNA-binding NarL/FixJ family response regulator
VKPHLSKRFIFITGHSNEHRIAAFLQRVNGLVIRKPASTEDLIRMISLVLTRSR